jgi:hypothetical protein
VHAACGAVDLRHLALHEAVAVAVGHAQVVVVRKLSSTMSISHLLLKGQEKNTGLRLQQHHLGLRGQRRRWRAAVSPPQPPPQTTTRGACRGACSAWPGCR